MLTAAQVTKRTGERDEPIIGLPPRPAEKLPPLPPQPLVSIVVPCRNPGSMLDLALHSLFMQDYPALEIIVVDAASTDGTPRRLQQISRPGFRFLSEPDKGQADALDKGFALAKGEILAWLNADDCLLPHAVSTWVALLQHQSAPALVYGGCFEWFADVGWMVPAPWIIPPDYQILRDRSDYIMQPAAAFRADAYHKVGGINPDLHYTMDWDLWLSLAESWPCGYREQVLAANRVHEATKTNTGGLARIREIRQVGRRHGRSRFSSANHRYSLVELSTRS
ncbi:MAG TPA: glycosyltransferase, partial [Phycisphaeraceae bacterium]|nr:glycosyltransferase [Phycisphaeraceae bacterium]